MRLKARSAARKVLVQLPPAVGVSASLQVRQEANAIHAVRGLVDSSQKSVVQYDQEVAEQYAKGLAAETAQELQGLSIAAEAIEASAEGHMHGVHAQLDTANRQGIKLNDNATDTIQQAKDRVREAKEQRLRDISDGRLQEAKQADADKQEALREADVESALRGDWKFDDSWDSNKVKDSIGEHDGVLSAGFGSWAEQTESPWSVGHSGAVASSSAAAAQLVLMALCQVEPWASAAPVNSCLLKVQLNYRVTRSVYLYGYQHPGQQKIPLLRHIQL